MYSKDSLSLFVFIDAYGWRISNRYPILQDEIQTKLPLETVFGYSSSCDPTIISGKMPCDHGHFTFYQYTSKQSPFRCCSVLNYLPKSLTSRGRVRHWLSRLVQAKLGYTGYFQLYNVPFHLLPKLDYSEKHDIYQPGGLINGTNTIFDDLRREQIPFSLSDWRKPETENIARLMSDIDAGEINFAYLYLAELDGILHRDGTHSTSVAEKVSWYDTELRKVLDAAKRKYKTVTLHLFSDHGMTNVTQHFDLISQIESLGLTYGKDYAAIYDSTMARFYFHNQSAKQLVRYQLAEISEGHILSDEWLQSAGCYFPDHRYGELFFLLNPGVLCVPSFMGEKGIAGMHGYDPQHKDSKATFISTETHVEPPRRLDDLYDLMKCSVDHLLSHRNADDSFEAPFLPGELGR